MRLSRIGRVLAAVTIAGATFLTFGGTAIAGPPSAPPKTGNPAVDADQAIAGSAKAPLADRIAAQLRLAPGGVQISSNEIAWEDGKVVMVFPLDGKTNAPKSSAKATGGRVATADVEGCPTFSSAKYYCFYEHINWGGRRLQFKDYPQFVRFNNWGFDNQTSSWVNTNPAVKVWVYDGIYNTTLLLWIMPGGVSKSSWVGSTNNDRASSFHALAA